jgi:hypothetical protein
MRANRSDLGAPPPADFPVTRAGCVPADGRAPGTGRPSVRGGGAGDVAASGAAELHGKTARSIVVL